MKRILTTQSLSLCIMSVAFSQKSPVKYGIKAGINIANISASFGGQSASSSSIVGLNAGVLANLPVTQIFSVQPEIGYSTLGAKIGEVVPEDGVSEQGRIVTGYIAVPLLAKVTVPNTGVAFYAGPQQGLLLSAKMKSASVSASIKDSYKSSDFSGIFGTEYFLKNGFGLSARYQLGFTNILKTSVDGYHVKNNSFTITVGYNF